MIITTKGGESDGKVKHARIKGEKIDTMII